MDLIDSLSQIATRAMNQKDALLTEEATKNALVMPFINALGYNVFDPSEVIPEFTADVGIKKGEKVDYAISIDGAPMILIECKTIGAELNLKHASQLFRYFSTTEARFAILTNGIEYHFYTDIEAANKMDDRPFFELSLLQLDNAAVNQIKKFSKSNFKLDAILNNASDLKYRKEIKKLFERELEEPSEEIVRHFAKQVHGGLFTAAVKEQFTALVRDALSDSIKERVNARIQSALDSGGGATPESAEHEVVEIDQEEKVDAGIETTEEEIEGYHIVRAMLARRVEANRIVMRDTKSYCGILLDDNNRKPICRLRFNYSTKYLSIVKDKQEQKHVLQSLTDLYQFEEQLAEALDSYETTKA